MSSITKEDQPVSLVTKGDKIAFTIILLFVALTFIFWKEVKSVLAPETNVNEVNMNRKGEKKQDKKDKKNKKDKDDAVLRKTVKLLAQTAPVGSHYTVFLTIVPSIGKSLPTVS